MVRGNLVIDGQANPHAWNEVELPDGRKLFVDVTNPAPYFDFLDTNSELARRYYRGVTNEVLYGQP
jgi:hypothetical protein